jgi:hypothetical protein
LEENLERLPIDLASEGNEILGASSFDDSESRSITSDFMSNPDSDSAINAPLDSRLEDVEDTTETDKKDKRTKLKHVLKDQLKDLSFDTVLLAGVQAAAGHMSFSSSFAFGSSARVKVIHHYSLAVKSVFH